MSEESYIHTKQGRFSVGITGMEITEEDRHRLIEETRAQVRAESQAYWDALTPEEQAQRIEEIENPKPKEGICPCCGHEIDIEEESDM